MSEGPTRTPRIGLEVARVGAGLALTVGAFLVLQPFLVPMAWAAVLALMTWPLYRRVRDWSRRPLATALAFTLAAFLCVGVPLTLLLANLASEGTRLVEGVQGWLEAGAPLPGWIAERSWLAAPFEELRGTGVGPERIAGWVQSYGTTVSGRLVDLAGAVARNVFSVLIMLVTLAIFYRDGDRLVAQAKELAPVFLPYAAPGFVDRLGASIRAVVLGLLGTALVQGTLAGIGFAVLGVPLPVALGALTAVISFVPGGTVAVWAPAALWLLFSGSPLAAFGLALWGALVVSTVDNWLRPLLISGAARIPFILVFFGVLGGLSAFGVLGLFLGPVLLSVAFTLLAEFTRPERLQAARADVPPATGPA